METFLSHLRKFHGWLEDHRDNLKRVKQRTPTSSRAYNRIQEEETNSYNEVKKVEAAGKEKIDITRKQQIEAVKGNTDAVEENKNVAKGEKTTNESLVREK